MKKLIPLFLILTLLCSQICFSYADSDNNNEEAVIENFVQALDKSEWMKATNLWVETEAEGLNGFFNNELNKKNNIGFYNIKSANMDFITQVENNILQANSDYDKYVELYGDMVRGYLVGTDLSVTEETNYFYNGLNLNLIILVKENNLWKIVEFSNPSSMLVDKTLESTKFRSIDNIDTVKNIIHQRNSNGIFINLEGQVIDTNVASDKQLCEERGVESITRPYTDYPTRPSNIRVYRSGSGKIETVDFYEYIKNVLPNEWGSGSPTESLRAGAQCVKMVGWFRVYNAKYSGKGYDVMDTTADQVYKPNTAASSCTSAINAVGSYGLETKSGYIFYSAYVAGIKGVYGTKSSGTVQQNGSIKQAQDGIAYWPILQYYYDYSNRTNKETLSSFMY